jgi:putative transcriptional regulator
MRSRPLPFWSNMPEGPGMASSEQDNVTNRIRRLRFDNGEMTQQELAERVGITRQTVIALEAGKYVPSLLLAFRLAAAFGVRVEDVFQYDAKKSP